MDFAAIECNVLWNSEKVYIQNWSYPQKLAKNAAQNMGVFKVDYQC